MVAAIIQLFAVSTIFLLIFRPIQCIPPNKHQHYNTDHLQPKQQQQAPETVQLVQPVFDSSSPQQGQQIAPKMQSKTPKTQKIRRRRPKAGIGPCPAHFSNSKFRYCYNRKNTNTIPMAANSEDSFSDFEHIPTGEDGELVDLDGPKDTSLATKDEEDMNEKNGRIIAALVKRVDVLEMKLADQSKESLELRTQQQLKAVLAKLQHSDEPGNAKFVLIENAMDVSWDTSTSQLNVTDFTVRGSYPIRGRSIRSTHGFSTMPAFGISDVLIYTVDYFEVTIDKLIGWIIVGLANENFPMDVCLDELKDSFSVGIDGNGTLWQWGTQIDEFGPGRFTKTDIVGCGVMVAQKTKNCENCSQSTVFFTKNGQIWGHPIPLPSNVPSMLYPTISLCYHGDQVTANFGHEPFKFEIPPAKGLNAFEHCDHCKQ